MNKHTTTRLMPGCDCGTCCNTCGHYPGCTSQDNPTTDPSDDYTHGEAALNTHTTTAEWRTARCEDCGEQIEINRYGDRTLCACDATE